MSSSTSSPTSSTEYNFENSETDVDDNLDPGPSCRHNIVEPESDEENEQFFRQRRVPKRQRQRTPSPSCLSDSDDEQLCNRVEAQSTARERRRHEMESPPPGQNYQHSDSEQSMSPTNRNFDLFAIHVVSDHNDDISLPGKILIYLINNYAATKQFICPY